ncbi:MAG: Ldh family oxidoreductase [Chloroflexi bacterium]|nr:Ldh family oxidoreductase [Chloroflexota bacterium]
MPTVKAEALRAYVARIFEGSGAPPDEAQTISDHLVEANLKGHDSHGVIRVEGYVLGAKNGVTTPGAPTTIDRESASTAVVNGNWNFGQVVARRAMDIAIGKARDAGVGVIVGHQSGHIGRVGAYGEQAAAAGFVAIACVNVHGAGRLVAAHGGAERRLSTNPIVVAGPTEDADAPFVLDMATSSIAEGKARVARNKGVQLAPGLLIDGEGRPTTEPWDLYGGNPPGSKPPGALLPVGGAEFGYKGFGLSMAVELLAGALSPAGTTRPDVTRGGNAMFMLVIDPDRLGGADAFRASLSGMVDFVKQPPFQEGFDEVLTAGEPERRRMATRLRDGIDLDDETWRQIASAAQSVGVEPIAG